MSNRLMRVNTVLMLAASSFAVACSGSGSESGADGGPVVVQAVDHPAVGHWMGTITMNGSRDVSSALQVDAEVGQPSVALTLIPAGAVYSECTVLETGENTLVYRFDSGKYDNIFNATLSPDGRELSGSITVPDGSSSAMEQGTFTYIRTPRASFAPGAMVFSKGMSGRVGNFTLTITLAELDDGRWAAELDIPEQSMDELPLFKVREENGVVIGEIKIVGPPMIFEMNLSDDRQRLTGSWKQGGASTPIDLPRVR